MSSAGAGNALTWPFYQHAWFRSLWMPLAWSIPFVGNSLALGWSVEAIRRRAHKDPQPLPQTEDLPSILAKGVVVLCFWMLFFAIPLLIMAWLMGWSWLAPIWQFAVLLWKALLHQPHENIASFLLRTTFIFLSDAAAPILYVSLLGPIFLVARVRYAVAGRASGFFCFVANTAFCLRHIGDVLLYFLLAYLLRIGVAIAAIFLLPIPILGQLLPFAFVGLGIWARAFWAGKLAILLQQERRSAVSM
jgi:hypothetical protein